MAAPLTYQQLPARCIIVTQYAWCFVAEIRVKSGQLANSGTLTSVAQLAAFINDWQLRKAGDVYRRLNETWSFEPLSYEQALELHLLELKTN